MLTASRIGGTDDVGCIDPPLTTFVLPETASTMADADSSQSSRHCRACACPIPKYKQLCRACFSSRRKVSQRQWPSRSKACVTCARVRRTTLTSRLLCHRCSQLQSRTLIPCPRCGKEFWPWANGMHARKFCSQTCIAKPKAQRSQLACAWCGSNFTPFGPQRYCSKRCARRTHAHAHHLRRRGIRGVEPIPIHEIYRRDNGRCGLCLKRVPADFGYRKPYSQAPTLDHIVPLSKGGKHVRENVQLAHFGCNSRKKNRPCGSQFRLI